MNDDQPNAFARGLNYAKHTIAEWKDDAAFRPDPDGLDAEGARRVDEKRQYAEGVLYGLRDKRTLAEEIATLADARRNCATMVPYNQEWFDKHDDALNDIARNVLPSGAGIDRGTIIDKEKSTFTKIVLYASFHHMNEAGYYDGWTDHTIVVVPTFLGLSVTVKGRNRNDIKELLEEVYQQALEAEYEREVPDVRN